MLSELAISFSSPGQINKLRKRASHEDKVETSYLEKMQRNGRFMHFGLMNLLDIQV
jgi:hypothetical protein